MSLVILQRMSLVTESRSPPLFSEKKDSKIKTEVKLHDVIHIDDDDDQGKRDIIMRGFRRRL